LDLLGEGMANDKFEVLGVVKIDNAWRNYKKIVNAPTDRLARERFYSIVGSKHRLKRNAIQIHAIKKIEGE